MSTFPPSDHPQIERKRRFESHAVAYAASSIVVVVGWAVSEYHNAGGWPSDVRPEMHRLKRGRGGG